MSSQWKGSVTNWIFSFCSGTFRFDCIRRKQNVIQSIYDLYQTFGNIDIFLKWTIVSVDCQQYDVTYVTNLVCSLTSLI